jgi:hypothetical protein
LYTGETVVFKEIFESENASKALRDVFDDSIVNRLLKYSGLTKIQLETLLINFVFDEIVGKDGGMYDSKGRARLEKESSRARRAKAYPKGVSRGAFRRVLFQACRNIVRSMYTLFLLGYIGILETPGLGAYLELSETVTQYRKRMEERKQEDGSTGGMQRDAFRLLEKSLMNMIDQYAFPFNVLGKAETGDQLLSRVNRVRGN